MNRRKNHICIPQHNLHICIYLSPSSHRVEENETHLFTMFSIIRDSTWNTLLPVIINELSKIETGLAIVLYTITHSLIITYIVRLYGTANVFVFYLV